MQIVGQKDVEKRLNRAANWSKDDKKNLRRINREVAKLYVKTAKSNIKSFPRDIIVQRRGSRLVVQKGQMKRSVGTWMPSRGGTWVVGGPRTNALGKRNTRENADGWFAHIVEGGDSFGRKKTTVNTGVFARSMRAVESGMRSMYDQKMKKEFSRYMK
jgi:hypothetical protein